MRRSAPAPHWCSSIRRLSTRAQPGHPDQARARRAVAPRRFRALSHAVGADRRNGRNEKAMTLRILCRPRQIADVYDGFIVDLWGVIHDGITAVCRGQGNSCCAASAAGKKTVMLSNAPRRAVFADRADGRNGSSDRSVRRRHHLGRGGIVEMLLVPIPGSPRWAALPACRYRAGWDLFEGLAISTWWPTSSPLSS